jgi:hypothetical protein
MAVVLGNRPGDRLEQVVKRAEVTMLHAKRCIICRPTATGAA